MARLDCAKIPGSARESLSSTVKESPSRRVHTPVASTSFVVQSSPQHFSHHDPNRQQSRQFGHNVQHKQQGILSLHRQATAESVHEVSLLDFLKHINNLNLLQTVNRVRGI